MQLVDGKIELSVTNNLEGGAITRLGFDFGADARANDFELLSVTSTGGAVGSPSGGLPHLNGALGSLNLDLVLSFANHGTFAFTPGEAARFVLSAPPDLMDSLLLAGLGYARVRGSGCAGSACEETIASPAIPVSSAETPVPVPEPSTLLLTSLGIGLLARRRRAPSRA